MNNTIIYRVPFISLLAAVFCVSSYVQAQEKIDVSPSATTVLAALAKTELETSRMIQASSVHVRFDSSFQATSPSEILSRFFAGTGEIVLSRWYQDVNRFRIDQRRYLPSGKFKEYSRGSLDGINGQHLFEPNGEPGHGYTGEKPTIGGSAVTDIWMGNLGTPNGLGAILQAGKSQILGEEKIGDLKTLKLRTTLSDSAGNPITYALWLSPERSFREARKRIEISMKGTNYRSRNIWYEPLSFVKFRDNWVPQKGVVLNWLVDNNGEIHWRNLEWFELMDVKPLITDRRSIFDFDFPVGTQVQDNRNQQQANFYIAGGDPKDYLEIFQAVEKPIEERVPKEVQGFLQRVVSAIKTEAANPQVADMLPRAEDDPQNKIAAPQSTMQVGQAAPELSVTDANGKM